MVRPNENPPQGTEQPQDPPPPEVGKAGVPPTQRQNYPPAPVTVEPPPIDIRADIVQPDKKG